MFENFIYLDNLDGIDADDFWMAREYICGRLVNEIFFSGILQEC